MGFPVTQSNFRRRSALVTQSTVRLPRDSCAFEIPRISYVKRNAFLCHCCFCKDATQSGILKVSNLLLHTHVAVRAEPKVGDLRVPQTGPVVVHKDVLLRSEVTWLLVRAVKTCAAMRYRSTRVCGLGINPVWPSSSPSSGKDEDSWKNIAKKPLGATGSVLWQTEEF